MAQYPIKMLKDEQGQPFVPLTHISAVAGEEYTTAVLNAVKQTPGHYKMVNVDLTMSLIAGKVIAVRFDDVSEATIPSYLKLNNENEKLLCQSDGINNLDISHFDSAVAFFVYINDKFQLLEVGATPIGGGHAITDTDGNVMTTRGVLHFDGAEVIDTPGQGATTVKTAWISQKILLKDDTTIADLWQPMLASAISVPQTGTYKISIYLKMGNCSTVNREIGIRLNKNGESYLDNQVWKLQYKRLRDEFSFYLSLNANDTIMPELYIDNITSTSEITIENAYMYIEYIPTKEVDING